MTKDELRKHCERMCARYAEANRVTTCLTYEEHKLVLDLLDTDDVLTKALVIQALEDVRAEITGNLETIIGKYDSNTKSEDMPSKKIERNNGRQEAIGIINRKIAELKGDKE